MVRRSSLRHALESGTVERLLVRAPNWLGDAAFAWPVFGALRRALPDTRIHVAARAAVADLIDAGQAADAVLYWPARPNWSGVKQAVSTLRAGDYSAALLLTHSFESALAPWLARVPHRLGYRAHGRGWLLSESLSRWRGTHQQDEYLALIAHLGLDSRPEDARIRLNERTLAAAAELAKSVDIGDGYAVLAPGAAYGGAKQWGAESFGELAAGLSAEGLQVVVVGGAGEREQAAAVMAVARKTGAQGSTLVDLSGRTGLADLAGLVAGARLLVGNDSGPLHLAAGLGTPALGLYGATDPERTGPRGARVAVLQQPVECSPCGRRECNQQAHHCMIRVTPGEALQRAVDLLGPKREA